MRDPKDLAEVEGWLRGSLRQASWQVEHGPEQDRDYHLGRRTALADVCQQLRRILGWRDPEAEGGSGRGLAPGE